MEYLVLYLFIGLVFAVIASWDAERIYGKEDVPKSIYLTIITLWPVVIFVGLFLSPEKEE